MTRVLCLAFCIIWLLPLQGNAQETLSSHHVFPTGDIFRPLVADPKQPQFFASFRRYDTGSETFTGASVGFGENFGLYRWNSQTSPMSFQTGIAAAVFALFNLDAASKDLINADYLVGVPFTFRYGDFSSRLFLYHQSSHLGDEFILRTRPERVNLSFESVSLVLSYEWGQWRPYLGGEYLFRREPGDLKPAAAQGGIEYVSAKRLLGIGNVVAGIDLKSYEEHRWAVDKSIKAGFEVGKLGGERRVRILLEGFRGYSPHGQFYNDKISYYGAGIYLGF